MQKKIAYGGICTSLCVLLTLCSVYFPTGKAALLFVASFLIYVLCLRTDKRTALICYGASSILIFFITSSSSPLIAVSFVLCFGNYPILKCIVEGLKKSIAWMVKALLYSIYFFAVYFSVKSLFSVNIPYGVGVLYFIGMAMFLFYDVLLQHTGKYTLVRFFKSF